MPTHGGARLAAAGLAGLLTVGGVVPGAIAGSGPDGTGGAFGVTTEGKVRAMRDAVGVDGTSGAGGVTVRPDAAPRGAVTRPPTRMPTGMRSQPQPAAAAADAVAAALRDDLDLDGIAVTLVGTEATLAGRVPTLWAKTEAIARALAFDAVETVASELTVPVVENDDRVADGVGRAIRTYRDLTIWDYVGGGVEDGVVTLTGSVTPDRDKAGDLFERVAKVRGVQEIRMRIVQQSASRRDTDLRRVIARRALRHPTLSHYTMVADIPPFRIVVDDAVVTLVGSVRSAVESRILESIARQAFETADVVNLLQHPG